MKRHLVFLTFLVLLTLQVVAHTTDAEDLNELKSTIQKLQEENKGLQEQLNKQREILEHIRQRTDKLETKDKGAVESTPSSAPPVPPPKAAGHDEPLESHAFVPNLRIRGFSDINFIATNDTDGEKRSSNTFALGQLDLFVTSELSNTISVLSEIVFEFDSNDNEASIDIERLQAKYAPSDLFNLRFGRMHTPLGYWNHTFHHGTWFQTTAFRPDVYRFEDDGGILPVHIVGLDLSGSKAFRTLDFGYSLTVGNGRGRTVTEVQNVKDHNKSKAINVLLTIAPHAIRGMSFGLNTYIDTIPPNPSDPQRNGDIDEFILGGHIVYVQEKVELLGEIFRIHHHDRVSRQNFDTLGGYFQGSYRFGLWKPYYRFDFINFGNGDPFYAPNDIDFAKHTLGIRWDPLVWMGIKLEYGYNQRKNAHDINAFTIQSSFAF